MDLPARVLGADGSQQGELASIFRALGDPLRLEMVRRLSKSAQLTIAAVSQGLGITRQGARKHLQVLADADLVKLQPQGRDVLVQLEGETFERAHEFLGELERLWDHRLEALKRFVEEEQSSP